MISKNIFILKNISFTVFKIILSIFFIIMIIIFPLTFLNDFKDKIYFLTLFIIDILPVLALIGIFLIMLIFITNKMINIEIYNQKSDFIPKPTKFWDLKKHTISPDIPLERNYPIFKVKILVSPPKLVKNLLVLSYIPLFMIKNSNFTFHFMKMLRLEVPTSFEKDDIVLVVQGGIFNRETKIPGDILLQLKPLPTNQYYFIAFVQYLGIIIPSLIYLSYLFLFKHLLIK